MTTTKRSLAAVVVALALLGLGAREARAGETTMSEPVIDENITDIDATEAPSIEFDLTPGLVRAQHSSAALWKNGYEVEWRPFDRAGVGAEIDQDGALEGWSPKGAMHFVPRGALSYVFLRDFEQRMFLQAEVAGRYDGPDTPALIDPTESVLPYQFGVRSATSAGLVDIRFSGFGEAGGSYVHAPVKGGASALVNILGERTRGAVGVELLADWARQAPFLLAPEGQYVARVLGKPVRFEVAFPFTLGAKGNDATFGVTFRFVLEPDE